MSDDKQQGSDRTSRDVSRRRLIAAGGFAAFTLGTAGCSQLTGSDGEDEEEEDEDEDETEEEPETTETPTATQAEENGIGAIDFGETREGFIDSEDENDPVDGDLAEPVSLDAQSGTTAEITMESADLDTYLILEAPDGSIVAEDDDGAGASLNSQIRAQLEQTGTYTIWAGTFDGNSVGAYTLSVSEIDLSERPDLETIAFGETSEGFVDAGDGSDPTYGDLAEGVRLDAQSGTTAVITMQAEFDTYLVLEGPDGSVVAEDDDGAGGLNSRIRTRLPQTGTYTIWAGSFSGDDTGAYTLSVEESDPSDRPDLESIDFGETSEGFIDNGDGTDPVDGDLAEPVSLDAQSGTTAVVSMSSDSLDTYLILEAPDGTVVAEDDDGGGGLNSRMQVQLPQTGTYTIWAGTFSGMDTGAYTLSVTRE